MRRPAGLPVTLCRLLGAWAWRDVQVLHAAQVNNLGNAPMPELYATVQSWMWDETERVANMCCDFLEA